MRITQEVQGAKTIGISGHVRPDGDCVGSCMAMALYLRKTQPAARVDVFLGDFSVGLQRNIAGVETINRDYITDVKSYDVFICLDCEGTRLGEAQPLYTAAAKRINIDHHVSNQGSGDVNYIVPTASSTCELVYEVMDKENMDAEIARNIYTGIFTDTGGFRFSNTSKRTMEIAGALIEYGFDFSTLIQEVYYQDSYVKQQIMGRALLESVLFMDGKCIFSMLDRKTLQFYRATSSDTDGIVSRLADTRGVEVSIFMYEIQPLSYKVSLRSNGDVNVAAIAEKFGGGGHVRAAGCTVNANYHDILNNISGMVEQQLEALKG